MAPKRQVLAEYGPFYGMRYAFDPTDNGENAGFVYEALNMVPLDPVRGGAYIRRVGDVRATVSASELQCRYLGVYRKRSGFVNVGIFAGEIYTLSGTTWTRQVTTANLATAGVALSATANCGAITYTNLFVINDGVNQPFTWDGTSGAGGLTLLSNAPTKCYGVPTIYYGKLFFIKDVAASQADRSTIVWSEENAPNTGYEAAGYSNAWTLEQSGSGPIFAIEGTNEALYFFRAHGIGAIRGAVSTNFSADGTHDGISTFAGTTSPFGVVNTGTELYFPLTQTGEPCVLVGGRVVHLGADIQDVIGDTKLSSGAVGSTSARAVWMPFYDGVVFAYNISSSTQGITGPLLFLYSIPTKRCLARFSFQFTVLTHGSPAIGMGYDATNNFFALVVAAQSGGSTYTFHTPPPSGVAAWYTAGTPAPTFQVTLAPYQSPIGTVAALDTVEAFFDLAPGSGGNTTATIAARQSNVKLVGGSTSDLGSVTLAPDSTHRQESRGILGVHQEWRTVQLSARDSGTLQTYPWGVKRLLLHGTTKPIEPETT